MRKREELRNPNSCLSRAGEDEMTFVLLGRDLAAPKAVQAWIDERIRIGKNRPDDPQIQEALAWIRTVQAEQNATEEGWWKEMNARRIDLAEKKSRGELSGYELSEFNRLQITYFQYLEEKSIRTPMELERLAEIERRLKAREGGEEKMMSGLKTVKCNCCRTNDISWPLPTDYPGYLGYCQYCQEYILDMRNANNAAEQALEEKAAKIAGVPYPIHSRPLIIVLAKSLRAALERCKKST